MFIGHFAVGFAAKKYAQRTPLVLLLAAPLFADLLWPIFLLVGWEHVRIDPGNTKFTPLDLYDYPWSHSLLMDCVWATAFALIYYAIARYWPGAVAIWIGVISHWILDWLTIGPTCHSTRAVPAADLDYGTRVLARWRWGWRCPPVLCGCAIGP